MSLLRLVNPSYSSANFASLVLYNLDLSRLNNSQTLLLMAYSNRRQNDMSNMKLTMKRYNIITKITDS